MISPTNSIVFMRKS